MVANQIAVLGYGLRVPGANDVDTFWGLIESGADLVTRAGSNVGATASARVHAYGLLEDADLFDEQYFGLSPRDAENLDPQQRMLLHCAVEAFERAGMRPSDSVFDVGVWASTGLSGYLLETIDRSRSGLEATSQLMGGDGHYAATRIAYHLGLTGPAVSVGSACSSSLLAVHSAAQAIAAGECDLALAGGIDIEYPQPMSYLYQEGGILSPDGICRPFDSAANGTVFGSGGGLVLLADLATATQAGWPIAAILSGSAVNNDGASKASFTAPRPSRQADVIRQALAAAELDPAAIAYIECHGTGTLLGDQSEIEALSSIFGTHSGIQIGSAKANFGHLRVGAGVIGLIKACEMLRRSTVPPLANLRTLSSTVASSGFIAPDSVGELLRPRQAHIGINSFGFGGTNVHAIVSASSDRAIRSAVEGGNGPLVLQVSAATPDSCIGTSMQVADHLRSHEEDMPAVAHTLRVGRETGRYRLGVVAGGLEEALRGLESDPEYAVEGWAVSAHAPIVLFTGQATELASLAMRLWDWEPEFTGRLAELAELIGVGRTELPDRLAQIDHAPVGEQHAFHTAIQLALCARCQAVWSHAVCFSGF